MGHAMTKREARLGADVPLRGSCLDAGPGTDCVAAQIAMACMPAVDICAGHGLAAALLV